MVYHGLFTSALSGGDIEFMVWSDSEERFQLLASRLRQQLRPNRWRCLEMPVVLAEFFWKGKHRHSSSAYWLEFLGKNTFFVQVELFVRIGECIVCGFPMFSLLLPWGMQRPQLWAPVGYTQFCPLCPITFISCILRISNWQLYPTQDATTRTGGFWISL